MSHRSPVAALAAVFATVFAGCAAPEPAVPQGVAVDGKRSPVARCVPVATASALALALAGCPFGGSPTPPSASKPPSNQPSFVPPSLAPNGAYSDSGIEVLGGSLFVEVRDTANPSQPIANATLSLYGPTLATATTNAQGQATFTPLAEGTTYRLVVRAAGYASQQSTGIEVKKKATSSGRPQLVAGAELVGQVTANGQPIEGAVVSDGLNSTLSDATGHYDLAGVTPGAVTLTASKSRFQVASQALTAAAGKAAGPAFALASATPTVYFDTTASSGIPASNLSRLRQHLADAGWTLGGQPPGREGVWVLASPSQALPAGMVEQLTGFVAQGGKLIVLGEWGGFAGFHNPGANALVHALGLHFNPDLLRDPTAGANPEWLGVSAFAPNLAVTAGVSRLQLYQACSVFGIDPMRPLAQTGSGIYRVQANAPTGAQSVIVGGPYKAGKAIVTGDASAWADEDTDGSGRANVDKADNMRLMAQLLDW